MNNRFENDPILTETGGEEKDGLAEIRAMFGSKELSPEAAAEAKELHGLLDQAIDSFEKPRLKEVLRGRFGLDGSEMTLKELSEQMGVSLSRVRNMELEALENLRSSKSSACRALRRYFIA